MTELLPDDIASLFLAVDTGLSKAIRHEILAALAEQGQKLQGSSLMQASGPRVLVAAAAAEALVGRGRHQAVLAFRRVARTEIRNAPQFLQPWMNAAHRSRLPGEAAGAFQDLRDMARREPHLRDFYFQMRQNHGSHPDADDHLWRWGDIPTDLHKFVRDISPDKAYDYVSDLLIGQLHALRGGVGLALPDFAAQLKWSNAVAAYFDFLRSATRGFIAKQKGGTRLSAAETGIVRNHEAISDLHHPPDFAAVQTAREAGRSAVMLGVHAGYGNATPLPRLMPITRIENIYGPAPETDNLNTVSPVSDGYQITFMKLIKSMRTSQRLVDIYPDGGHGQNFTSHAFCGQTVRIGRGAARIAHLGRAATFFRAVGWKGGMLHTTLLAGPVADPAEPLEAFEDRLNRFYLDAVRDLLLGPPENIGLARAFWPAFAL
jgi:hypothetical protein